MIAFPIIAQFKFALAHPYCVKLKITYGNHCACKQTHNPQFEGIKQVEKRICSILVNRPRKFEYNADLSLLFRRFSGIL